MRKYDYLTDRMGQYLLPIAHPYDWGSLDPKTRSPIPQMNRATHTMLLNRVDKLYLRKLNRTHLQNHLRGEAVIYYRGDTRARMMLLNLDIDAENAEEAKVARAAADYITKSLHRGAYHEPSTGGHGRHLYLRVRWDKGSVRQWREMVARYLHALRVILQHENIHAKIDRVCGLPTAVTKVREGGWRQLEVQDGDTGILSKIPSLPDGHSSMDRLEAAPTFSIKGFVQVIRRAERLTKGRSQAVKYRYTCMLTSAPNGSAKTQNRPSIDPSLETDAFRRMFLACRSFELQHGKYPTAAELVEFYERQGLHSGISEIDRRRRYKNAAAVVRYRSSHKLMARQPISWQSRKEQFIGLVQKYVAPEHIAGVKCDRTIAVEDLAIGLYAITINAIRTNPKFERQFTCGNDAIIGVFRTLRDGLETDRGCNINKASAIRRILAAAGLAMFVDHRYRVGGKGNGVAKKMGLTEVHPFYEEFVKIRDETGWRPAKHAEPSRATADVWIDDDLNVRMKMPAESVAMGGHQERFIDWLEPPVYDFSDG